MSECIHGLDDEWCATCKHGPEREEPERIRYAFDAQYDGHCPECNLPISVGQFCVKTSRDRTLHRKCIS
jgi:hypothetical protein